MLINFNIYSQSNLQVEISWEIGFLYQSSKLLDSPVYVIDSPRGLSLSTLPNFGSAITMIQNKNFHKIRLNFSEWQQSFSYNSNNNISSSSESYLFITYNWGKRWQIKESNKMNFQLSFGPTLGVMQKSRLPQGRDQTVSINIDGDLITIIPQDFRFPTSSLGLNIESVLKIQIYKSIGMQFGINSTYWFNPILGDREFKLTVNSDSVPDSVIRTYKHILAFHTGISIDF